MAIPETQLDTWSKQGSVAQSQATYQSIRGCLTSSDAPYSGKSYDVFLQGSYGNDTNIYADSDVDVVISLTSTYYEDVSDLTAAENAAYQASSSAGTYSYRQFKIDVTTQLTGCYGEDVEPGNKAIFVKGRGQRRDADVLAAAQFRRYFRFESVLNQNYAEGIVFWTNTGTQIVNYPKQHSANCTRKHQGTNSWFKPCVRIIKNMRNAMIDADYIEDGLAPSYFLEGALYNVPNSEYGYSYQSSMVNILNWLNTCDRSALLCANEMYVLLHPNSPVTWREEKFDKFLREAIRFWNDW